jgi:hypothetical protein
LPYPNKPALGVLGVTALIIAGVIGVAVSGTASGSMELASTTLLAAPGVEVQVQRPVTELARAVANALPAGAKVMSEATVMGGRADYEDLTVVDPKGGQWGVTIYRSFDQTELAQLEVEKSAIGTTWFGADDPDLSSIYFLNSSTHVGVWIGYQRTGSNPVGRATLQAVAERLTIDPSVMGAAK